MVRPGHRGHKNSLPQKKKKITERARKTYKQNKFYFEKKKRLWCSLHYTSSIKIFLFFIKKNTCKFF
jgi:hypothetical protein